MLTDVDNADRILPVSVIIPVYNDWDGLRITLQSLMSQNHPKYEVIVVDNGSTDGTLDKAVNFQSHHADRVRVLQEPRRSSYAARNRGWQAASGDILCFLDADMTVPVNYLRDIAELFGQGATHLGCRVDLQIHKSTYAALYNAIQGFPVREYVQRGHFVPTCCLSISRAAMLQVGGFDSRLESGGDKEFGGRAYALGLPAQYAGEISVVHPARGTIRGLLVKSARTGRGSAQLERLHPVAFRGVRRQMYSVARLRPLNPLGVKKRASERGVPIRTFAAVCVAILHPLVRAAKIWGYVRG